MWKPDFAIAELIAGMKKPSRVARARRALNRCTALPPKELYCRFAAIPPVRMNGLTVAVPRAFRDIWRNSGAHRGFITSPHSRITAERLQQLMRETGQLTADVGTPISGNPGRRTRTD